MWKNLYDLTKKLFSLTKDTEQNKADIKELQQRLRDLSATVERMAYEIRFVRETERHEREKIVLQLENEMLKFERRLPPPKPSRKPKEEN